MDIKTKSKWASAIIGSDQYKTDLILDNHTLVGDEPLENGGKDLGPSPGDLIRLSLASCTAITLRMYANRKGFDVRQIEVKIHTEATGNKTIFHRLVQITGNIDEAQRKRMMQIADKCPVHKMLTNPIEIITQFTEAA
jgi:putative redox protein